MLRTCTCIFNVNSAVKVKRSEDTILVVFSLCLGKEVFQTLTGLTMKHIFTGSKMPSLTCTAVLCEKEKPVSE